MKHVTCLPEVQLGKIRPQHSICNWPRPLSVYDGGPDTEEFLRVKGIFESIDSPMTRLKYFYVSGYGKHIDVPFIFHDFRKDASDPANYFFHLTDQTILDFVNAGKPIIYRLGAVRENWSVLYTRKPDDYDKFAQVCLNIVRHLNDGWADGLHCGIEYWEIWNRADDPHCWTGTAEDYYRLYEVTARKIKEAYPHLKVGGPAAADCRDMAFINGFVQYIKEHNVPCDFISWNYFGVDAAEAGRQAVAIRQLVKDAGLQVEIFNDEWNAISVGENGIIECPDARTMKGTAFGAAFMMQMQNAGIDGSTYYDGTCGTPWGALYASSPYRTHKPIFSLLAFSRLYRLGNQIGVKTVGKNLYAAAAENEGRFALMIALCQDRSDKLHLTMPFPGKKLISLLDEKNDLEQILETEDTELTLSLKGHSVVLVESI